MPEITKEDIEQLYNRIYFFIQDCGVTTENVPCLDGELSDIFYETLGIDIKLEDD